MMQAEMDCLVVLTGQLVGEVHSYNDKEPKVVFTLSWHGIRWYVEYLTPPSNCPLSLQRNQEIVVIGKMFPRQGKPALQALKILPVMPSSAPCPAAYHALVEAK